MELDKFIQERDVKVRDTEHLKVIKYFYPYLRSVSGDERLLPANLEKILGVSLSGVSVVTACFNGVNDNSQPPYDNVDLYIKLNNDIKVFVYGRNQEDVVELKENEYVICLVAGAVTPTIRQNVNRYFFIEFRKEYYL